MVDGGQWVTLPIIACMCVAVYAFVYACVSQCGCVSAFLSSHAGASPGSIPFHHLKLGHAPATLSDTRVFAAQASVPKAFHHKLCGDGAWHELCGIARAPQGADTASSSVGTASSSVGSLLGRFQTCTVAAADVPLRVRGIRKCRGKHEGMRCHRFIFQDVPCMNQTGLVFKRGCD